MVSMPNPGIGPDSEPAASKTSRFRPKTSLSDELLRAQTFTGATGAALFLLEDDDLVWLSGVGQEVPEGSRRLALEGSFAALCRKSKKPQKCDDADTDARMDAGFRSLRAKSLALAPVHEEGKVTGILAVFSTSAAAFTGMHLALLQTQADGLVEMVQLARQSRREAEERKRKKEEQAAQEAAQRVEAAPQPPLPFPVSPAQEAKLEPAPPKAAIPPPDVKPEAAPPRPANSPEFKVEAPQPAVVWPAPTVVVAPPPVMAPGVLPQELEPKRRATDKAAAEAVPTPPPAPVALPAPPPVTAAAPTPAPARKEKPRAAAPAPAAKKSEPVVLDLTAESMGKSAASAPASAAAPSAPPAREAAAAERPTLPGFAPLSAAASLLAKAKPTVTVTTPPPMPAPVVRPAAAPALPKAKPAAPPAPEAREKKERPTATFVPLAKAESKFATPPPAPRQAAAPSAPVVEPKREEFLPAAADPLAEPRRIPARPARPARPSVVSDRAMLAGLESVGQASPAESGRWRMPAVLAAVVVVVLGGWWLSRGPKTKSIAAPPLAAAPQPAPAQPAPALPAAEPPAPATATAASNPSAPASAKKDTATKIAETSKPANSTPAQKSAVLSAPATEPTVSAPAPLAGSQAEPPKPTLSMAPSAPVGLPDLPKPGAAVAAAVKQSTPPTPAQLLQRVNPAYPATARAMRQQGEVRVSATVGKDGRVTEVRWVSGNTLFKDAAISAVKQWRYKPATVDGQPIESVIELTLKFGVQ